MLFYDTKDLNDKEIYLHLDKTAPENTASRKTCEYSGAELIEIADVPSWHEMYKTGRKRTCQYMVKI